MFKSKERIAPAKLAAAVGGSRHRRGDPRGTYSAHITPGSIRSPGAINVPPASRAQKKLAPNLAHFQGLCGRALSFAFANLQVMTLDLSY